jgi:ribonuclease P protein component
MLSRKNRIPTKQFPGVTRGKTLQNEFFRVVIKIDPLLKTPKCAVIVSNKVAKTAVARNKIRRQVYELLGQNLAKLPIAYLSVFPKKADMTPKELLCLKPLLFSQ